MVLLSDQWPIAYRPVLPPHSGNTRKTGGNVSAWSTDIPRMEGTGTKPVFEVAKRITLGIGTAVARRFYGEDCRLGQSHGNRFPADLSVQVSTQ